LEPSLEARFSYLGQPESPEIELGKESIRLAVSALSYTQGRVTFKFHARFVFPLEVAERYRHIQEALVLIVHDVDQRDGFAMPTFNDFITYPEGSRDGPNMLTPPALPLPPRGAPVSNHGGGGWVNGAISFASPPPKLRPSIYTYLVLENYVSNVLAFDLVDQKVLAK
jgi:hypothetical protein